MECEHNILRRPKHCYDSDEYHCRKCDTYVTILEWKLEKIEND